MWTDYTRRHCTRIYVYKKIINIIRKTLRDVRARMRAIQRNRYFSTKPN